MEDLNNPFAIQPPSSAAPAVPSEAPPPTPAPPPRQVPAGLLFAVFLVPFVLVFGGILWYLWPRPPEPEETPATPRGPIFVSRAGQDKNAVPSVKAALSKARGGDRIILLDDAIEEQFNLQNKDWKKEVVIEPSSDKSEVVWKPPSMADETRPLLGLGQVEGLRIRKVTFDGGDRLQMPLRLMGECPNLILEDVQVQRFTRYGVQIINCAGKTGRAVTLQNVKIMANRPAEAALAFETHEKMFPPLSQLFVIQGCRFVGTYKEPVRITGSKPEKVVFNNNHLSRDESDVTGRLVTLPQ